MSLAQQLDECYAGNDSHFSPRSEDEASVKEAIRLLRADIASMIKALEDDLDVWATRADFGSLGSLLDEALRLTRNHVNSRRSAKLDPDPEILATAQAINGMWKTMLDLTARKLVS